MITELEKFPSDSYGLVIGLEVEEIDTLILRLNELKAKRIDHFHCRRRLEAADVQGKMFDVEFFLATAGGDALHDMELE